MYKGTVGIWFTSHGSVQEGNEVFFRIKRSTQFKKLMNAYCDRQSVEMNSIAFLFDGRRLRADQTPDELEMEDGDEIDAMLHQTGDIKLSLSFRGSCDMAKRKRQQRVKEVDNTAYSDNDRRDMGKGAAKRKRQQVKGSDKIEYSTGDSSEDSSPVEFRGTSDSGEDSSPVEFRGTSDSSEDSSPVEFRGTSDSSEDSSTVNFRGTSDSSEDSSPVEFRGTSDSSEDSSPIEFSDTSDSSEDSSPGELSDTSDSTSEDSPPHE
nr:small ubiquitin-related modifier 1-like [Tanacetum cinerariifolium]